MSRARVAFALAGGVLGLFAASIVFSVFTNEGFDIIDFIFLAGIGVAFAAVGILIAARVPDNRLAWIFLAAAVGAGLGAFSGSYADYWVDTGSGPDWLGKTAAIYGDISWVPFILLPVTFLLLLFPNGRLPSRRWRPIGWSAGGGIALTLVTGLLKSGPISDYPSVRNMYGVKAGPVDGLEGLGALLVAIGLAGSVAAIIVRFRRARGVERQQMKWLAYAGAIAGLTLPAAIAVYDASEALANGAIMLSVLALAAATAVAILRYRLYDIDVVVNRTLVYGALTATLAAVYVGSVLLLQLALNGATQGSGLAVAVSTLGVAALFRPARTRIQGAVDHRFFRRKYDAAQTLEAFSARLRDEVDLAALNGELSSVVRDTLQPAHVSVWLRSADR